MNFPQSSAVFVVPFNVKSNDKTIGDKYWHFCLEIESLQRTSSLQGPRPLAIILEHNQRGRGHQRVTDETFMTAQKYDGQHYFKVGFHC